MMVAVNFGFLALLMNLLQYGDCGSNSSIPCVEDCTCIQMSNGIQQILVNCSNIRDLPSDLPLTTSTLILSHNSFKQFDLMNLSHLVNLRRLVLDHCEIETFMSTSAIQGYLKKLEIIDLGHNKLREIPLNLPPSLRTLQLSYNSIDSVKYEESLFELKNLRELFLDNNIIPSVKVSAFHDVDGATVLKNLQKVTLNSNKINFIIGESFHGLESLSALTLARNKLVHMERELFTGLKNLHHLDVSHNKLRHLDDDSFIDLIELKYLNLHNNKLSSFPKRLPMLEWLDLSRNQITMITFSSKPLVYPIEVLNLADNPFQCDCHMRWLKEIFDRRQYIVKHLDVDNEKFIPTCASPQRLAGISWDRLKDDEFSCDESKIDDLDKRSHVQRADSSHIKMSTRIGLVTDSAIQLIWSSTAPNFSLGNVIIQYYVFGNRASSMRHLEVAAAQLDYTIKHLRPETNYVICLQDREVTDSSGTGDPPPPISLNDCIEVATKVALPPPLTSRFEVFSYYILGMLATIIGLFAAIGGFTIIYGLWTHKTDLSSKYVVEEAFIDELTYATDEPITKDNKPHKD